LLKEEGPSQKNDDYNLGEVLKGHVKGEITIENKAKPVGDVVVADRRSLYKVPSIAGDSRFP